jgi:hypothetical protein
MYKERRSIFFVKGSASPNRWPLGAVLAALGTWQNELARSLVQQTRLPALSARPKVL